jgi:hypothetical protein
VRFASVLASVIVVALTLASGRAMTPPVASAAEIPVLGAVFGPNQVGFGTVRPRRFYGGGSPAGLVQRITWKSWGERLAVGRGYALYVARGQSIAQAKLQRARVVASQRGTCKGHRAYRKVEWYFPGHRGRYGRPNNSHFDSADMCPPPVGPVAAQLGQAGHL